MASGTEKTVFQFVFDDVSDLYEEATAKVAQVETPHATSLYYETQLMQSIDRLNTAFNNLLPKLLPDEASEASQLQRNVRSLLKNVRKAIAEIQMKTKACTPTANATPSPTPTESTFSVTVAENA